MFAWILGLLFGLAAVPLALALPQTFSALHGAPFAAVFGMGAAGGVLLTVLILRKALLTTHAWP